MLTVAELISSLKVIVPAWAATTAYVKDKIVSNTVSTVTTYYIVTINSYTSAASIATDITAGKLQVYTFFQECIDDAIGNAERETNRTLATGTFIEYADGTGTDEIYVKNYPLTALSAIEERDGDGVLTDLLTSPDNATNSSLLLDGGRIKLLKGYTFTYGTSNIRVSGTAGYSASTIPDGLKEAIKINAMMIWYDSPNGQSFFMKSSANMGGAASTGYSIDRENLIKQFSEKYNSYRRYNI